MLGLIELAIGAPEQGFPSLGLAGLRHAYADRDGNLRAENARGVLYSAAQALCISARFCPRCVRQVDRELLSADASQHVAFAHRAAQCPGHVLQHHVAALVAVQVVDALEVINITDDQRSPGARVRVLRPRTRLKAAPVIDAGEPVPVALASHLINGVRGDRHQQRDGQGDAEHRKRQLQELPEPRIGESERALWRTRAQAEQGARQEMQAEQQHHHEQCGIDAPPPGCAPHAQRRPAKQQPHAYIQRVDTNQQVAVDIVEVPEHAHHCGGEDAEGKPGQPHAGARKDALHHQTGRRCVQDA
ncbi:hypothetical protein D3C72_1045100 [compost metagenome]